MTILALPQAGVAATARNPRGPTPKGTYAGVILLLAMILAVFQPLASSQFINFDDNVYILENPQVRSGLSAANVSWAFKAFHAGTWQPLTWISYMLDAELYGLNPGGFHRTNLLLHFCNAAILFAAMKCLTGALWPSWVVAALFAVHPLHVESAAWVAERKGLLSAFFGMSALLAYAWHRRAPRWSRYGVMSAMYVFSLLSKPMLITLPFVLLLIDYWPLGRLRPSLPIAAGSAPARIWPALGTLLWEKVPLFILAAAATAVTWLAQGRGLASVAALPPEVRISNALFSYVAYLAQAVVPIRLAVFYPHPGAGLPMWEVAGAGLLLLTITATVVWHSRTRGYLLTGWFWYLGTLVPVIGLVQTGMHARADRFTYIPLTGLSIIVVWGIVELTSSLRLRRPLLAVAAALALCLFSAVAWRQTTYWRDSRTLFSHALRVTEANFVAHNHLGMVFHGEGAIPRAIDEYSRSVGITDKYPYAQYNLGAALYQQQKYDEALVHLRRASELAPNDADTQNHLGVVLNNLGRHEEALVSFREAVRLNGGDVFARNNLASALFMQRRYDEAVVAYQETLRLDQGNPVLHCNLGLALAKLGRLEEAASHFVHALRLDPNQIEARRGLERIPPSRRAGGG